MTPTEYIKLTNATDHNEQEAQLMGLRAQASARLLHYVLGVGTEAGELQDAVKRLIAYNKELDVVNIKEEIGDCLWYLSRICDFCGFTFEEVMELNINKLKARYGEKFSEHAALNRDLVTERSVLENG